jgi:hypothetical protein
MLLFLKERSFALYKINIKKKKNKKNAKPYLFKRRVINYVGCLFLVIFFVFFLRGVLTLFVSLKKGSNNTVCFI